jgi:hypothetical protein
MNLIVEFNRQISRDTFQIVISLPRNIEIYLIILRFIAPFDNLKDHSVDFFLLRNFNQLSSSGTLTSYSHHYINLSLNWFGMMLLIHLLLYNS